MKLTDYISNRIVSIVCFVIAENMYMFALLARLYLGYILTEKQKSYIMISGN